MEKTLFAWLGKTDIEASQGIAKAGDGPILQGIRGGSFEKLILLSNFPKTDADSFVQWLQQKRTVTVESHICPLKSPTNHAEIFEAVDRIVTIHKESTPEGGHDDIYFHLSPGTPSMHAVWLLISKTKHPARLIETSREKGYSDARVPFDITAEFVPEFIKSSDQMLKELNLEKAPQWAAFSEILHKGSVMKRVIHKAIKVAPRSTPVLIEGESGTGKELFARAIHNAGPRKSKPFIAVNCGAIPPELIESELFGHMKGSFSGATTDRKGHFESASGGTIFLDEIGELPLPAQVKLLRVLQQSEITAVGASHPKKIDVRVISATHRDLIEEVSRNAFREDLFYRLAVLVLKIPPLRERPGDISLLVDSLLGQINEENSDQAGYEHKKLSASAKNLILQHAWPGNVRELQNTLRRAAIWCEGQSIGENDIKEALTPSLSRGVKNILELPFDDGFNLKKLLDKVATTYIERAQKESGGNKAAAAKLLGLPNYQTVSNWAKKYGVSF